MSTTSALRISGFVILVISVAFGLLPLYATSAIADSWGNVHWAVNDFQIMDIAHLPNGDVVATVTSAVWFAAALGELMILAAWLKDARKTDKPMSLRMTQPLA